MDTNIDEYLKSNAALNQTESAQGYLLHPGEAFGGFRVAAFLGRGATSEVWRVHDESLNADFAMKIFAPREASTEKDTARLRRHFIAEARCLAQFTHPGIVRVHVLNAECEHPFYTMDLLHPLVRPMAKGKARKIIGDVLTSLNAIHAKGVVHRDIKSANVLLDDNGNALLTDFGIAQIDGAETAAKVAPAGGESTSAGDMHIAGTPDFSAPEQFIGADATPASDLHAVGRLALWLFDGKPSLAWRWFVMRATNSSPALRYKSAKAMQCAMHVVQLLGTLPIAIGCFGAAVIISLCAIHFKTPEPLDLFEDADIADTNILCRYNYLDDEYREQKQRGTLITLKNGQTYETEALQGRVTYVNTGYNEKLGAKTVREVREPIIIQGRGTLRANTIAYAEVHLMPGVELITSGEYHDFYETIPIGNYRNRRNRYEQYAVRPSQSASTTNYHDRVYASYIVEPGAKLVFTDNPHYPESLIERKSHGESRPSPPIPRL